MIPLILAAAAAAMSLYGQQQAKEADAADAQFEAGQLRQQAGLSRAVGQRQASEERRRARLIESALQARAGGSGSDASLVNLSDSIAGEGEYRALSALYGADTEAVSRETQADATLRSQKARGKAADYAMAGTALSGASSMYGKYGGGGK